MGAASSAPAEMAGRRYLVTGAYGCVGAWVVRELLDDGCEVVTFDLSADPQRLRLLLDPDELATVRHAIGDITDLEAIGRVMDEHTVTDVIHLAALQVPFCRADPPLGARVNVLGTVNVFEAVKARRDRIRRVVYASSVAAFDSDAPTMFGHPSTLYGVFKRDNESCAAVYWQDDHVSSIGLRPHTIFGVGRDSGVTSGPTYAMLAAAAGTSYTIPYGGRAQLQFARDVARAFIASARADGEGASVHNLPGWTVPIQDVVDSISAVAPASRGAIRCQGPGLPFPSDIDSRSFEAVASGLAPTPLQDAVRLTIERFRELLAVGLLAAPAAGG
jgi:nucleoside-diphosphate-sugar epimerase